jgi:hemerythrin superfamily protein
MQSKSIEKMKTLAYGLGDLLNKIVLIGGSVLEFYVTDSAAPEALPTDDINAVVTVNSMLEYRDFEQKLEKKGFEKAADESPFIKTWFYQGVKLYLTPMHTDQVEFHNIWYEEGVFHSIVHQVNDYLSVRIFSSVYYLASKIEAFLNRGGEDFRMSEDFQDIIYLLDNRPELEKEIKHGFYQVREYIQNNFRQLLSHADLEEGICYALPYGLDEYGVEKIKQAMERIAGIEYSMR